MTATDEQIDALAAKLAEADTYDWDADPADLREDYRREARRAALAVAILRPLPAPTCGERHADCDECGPCVRPPRHRGTHDDGCCTWGDAPAPEAPVTVTFTSAESPDFLALLQCPCPRHDGKPRPAPEAPAAEAGQRQPFVEAVRLVGPFKPNPELARKVVEMLKAKPEAPAAEQAGAPPRLTAEEEAAELEAAAADERHHSAPCGLCVKNATTFLDVVDERNSARQEVERLREDLLRSVEGYLTFVREKGAEWRDKLAAVEAERDAARHAEVVAKGEQWGLQQIADGAESSREAMLRQRDAARAEAERLRAELDATGAALVDTKTKMADAEYQARRLRSECNAAMGALALAEGNEANFRRAAENNATLLRERGEDVDEARRQTDAARAELAEAQREAKRHREDGDRARPRGAGATMSKDQTKHVHHCPTCHTWTECIEPCRVDPAGGDAWVPMGADRICNVCFAASAPMSAEPGDCPGYLGDYAALSPCPRDWTCPTCFGGLGKTAHEELKRAAEMMGRLTDERDAARAELARVRAPQWTEATREAVADAFSAAMWNDKSCDEAADRILAAIALARGAAGEEER